MNEDIELFSRAVRGHWSVESMHWQLDVTFKEDANTTLDKQAAENLNIIRKWCLSILKMVEIFRPPSLPLADTKWSLFWLHFFSIYAVYSVFMRLLEF
ncbi:MAG: hypothetical protein ACLTXB_18080 [Flintibacter sp.]